MREWDNTIPPAIHNGTFYWLANLSDLAAIYKLAWPNAQNPVNKGTSFTGLFGPFIHHLVSGSHLLANLGDGVSYSDLHVAGENGKTQVHVY